MTLARNRFGYPALMNLLAVVLIAKIKSLYIFLILLAVVLDIFLDLTCCSIDCQDKISMEKYSLRKNNLLK